MGFNTILSSSLEQHDVLSSFSPLISSGWLSPPLHKRVGHMTSP